MMGIFWQGFVVGIIGGAMLAFGIIGALLVKLLKSADK